MADDPHALFEAWLAEARAGEPNDPEAMALATADASGAPSVRMVLLKGHDQRGFVFYTNSLSRKGGELAENPRAALLFHWKSLRRQIRIRGPVDIVSDAEADAYFATRHPESRRGAHASQQSRPLENRARLEAEFAEIAQRYPGETIPRPAYWSGFRVRPLAIEFWKDGAHRLHDRVTFRRADLDAPWQRARLYP